MAGIFCFVLFFSCPADSERAYAAQLGRWFHSGHPGNFVRRDPSAFFRDQASRPRRTRREGARKAKKLGIVGAKQRDPRHKNASVGLGKDRPPSRLPIKKTTEERKNRGNEQRPSGCRALRGNPGDEPGCPPSSPTHSGLGFPGEFCFRCHPPRRGTSRGVPSVLSRGSGEAVKGPATNPDHDTGPDPDPELQQYDDPNPAHTIPPGRSDPIDVGKARGARREMGKPQGMDAHPPKMNFPRVDI